MVELGKSQIPDASAPPDADPAVLIEALRARNAEHFDPVGFRFIEALARRAAGYQDSARRELDRRLAKAVAEYGERFDRAQRDAGETRAHDASQISDTPDGCNPLAQLLADIRQASSDATADTAATPSGVVVESRRELKSLSYFRSTWSKLSLNRQLTRSFAQAPENAGPLNSHFLVLQSLKQMRDISPQYLEQFMSYADTLLWLDQAESGRAPAQKNAVRSEANKKRKFSGRSAG
ncbi:MAG TPA: DUF2894 domain-containing protein [Aromatoleum sp.]|uniref:DUF2894 domain-containing protein n=1 Tax=Aromatoleum sp. TaxID=2307007 RepID=UPI002B4A963F|nr:DUF2894 domain-containing protein [Aromatoleum sp.]HJV24059.1 DUF2894 domain-containing protein [Aromatoleum sp.]